MNKNIVYIPIIGVVLAGLSVYRAFGYESMRYCIVNFGQIFLSTVALAVCMYLVGKIRSRAIGTFSKWICSVGDIVLILIWGYIYNLVVYTIDDPIPLSTYSCVAAIVLVVCSIICLIYIKYKQKR